jgi:glycosyltransferase involved in cell wall biosynthesis
MTQDGTDIERTKPMNSISVGRKIPTISVLLPVFNAEIYLQAAMESVLSQTFEDFELLALDDGSTDGSLRILKSYAAKDDRIRIISRENKGLVETLNELISEAKGQYLARMDADDICMPQRFEKQVAFMDAHPDHVVVGTRLLLIDEEGLPLATMINNFTHEEIDCALLKGVGLTLCHPSTMIRKPEVLAVGGYSVEKQFAQDCDLWLRLAEKGKLANLPDVLIKYRQHLSSIGYANREEQLCWHKMALLDAYNRRKLEIPDWLPLMDQQVSANPSSESDHHRKWAWWALRGGNIKSARKHAVLALRKDPFKIESWRAFACAVRGR